MSLMLILISDWSILKNRSLRVQLVNVDTTSKSRQVTICIIEFLFVLRCVICFLQSITMQRYLYIRATIFQLEKEFIEFCSDKKLKFHNKKTKCNFRKIKQFFEHKSSNKYHTNLITKDLHKS